MSTCRNTGFILASVALTWTAPASADEGSHYPTQICTVSEAGQTECVPLESLPSRALIERLVLDLAASEGGPIDALHCDGVPADAVAAETATPAPAKRRSRRTERRIVDPVQWSLTSVERAEQNLLALLRSCHARHNGGIDPVEAGHVPTGAASLALLAAPGFEAEDPGEDTEPASQEVESGAHGDEVMDAPARPTPVELEPDTAESPETAVALAADSSDLDEDFGPALSDTVDEEATIPQAPVRELPPEARIVAGYDELRPSVRRLEVTWLQGSSQTANFGIDPCSDPIAMPTLGECELSL